MSSYASGRRASAFLMLAAMGATAAHAAEVTLKMKGGDFSVTGDLQAFDNSKYTIQSKSFGVMSLDASRFDCEGPGCPKAGAPAGVPTPAVKIVPAGDGHIQLIGSNTIGGQLMPALVQAYFQSQAIKTTKIAGENPLDLTFKLADAKGADFGTIELHRHGSGTAFKAFEQKAPIDIGLSSRPIKAEEAAKLSSMGYPDMRIPANEHVLGLDGLEVLVAPGNPAVSLSLDNIAKIFGGVIKDWSEVGLPAGKINVYAPTPESGTFETFDTLVLHTRNLKLVDTAMRTENHAEQSDLVAADPNGIGFTGIAYQRNAKSLNIETSCGLIVRPSVFSMKTEEYPLLRRLYLYTVGEPKQAMARGLLAFAVSGAAQPIVRQNDFIDQEPEALEFQAQTTRIAYALNAPGADFDLNLMKSLIADLKPARRLSTTFRFETATYALDSKATADVGRLREILDKPDYKNKTVILAGFADGVGRFDSNLELSQRRAASVLSALQRSGAKIPAQLVTKAYSQLAPVACNDSPESRTFNRRVEVWVK